MKTVLFIIVPFPSHYNSCLGVMQARQRAGYNVVATAPPALIDYVESLGVTSLSMTFMSETLVQNWRVFVALLIQRHLSDTYMRKRYRDFLRPVKQMEAAVEKLCPEEIYLDSGLSHYYPLLTRFTQCITLLNTRLSTRKTSGIPPYTSPWIVKPCVAHTVRTELVWYGYQLKTVWKRWIRHIAFGRAEEDALVARLAHRRNPENNVRWQRLNVGYAVPLNVPEWILCPKSLEYPWHKPATEECYVWYPAERYDNSLSADLVGWLASIRPEESVIYCSLGTLIHQPVAELFLRRVLMAVGSMPNVRLVMAAGHWHESLADAATTDKTFLTDRIPQVALLPYCDVVVTQGGMNTVQECICAGVPMLVYPLNKKVDQPGNAARVVYHGIGLAGKMSRSTPNAIRENLRRLLGNQQFKQRVLTMRERFYSEAASPSLSDSAESHKINFSL